MTARRSRSPRGLRLARGVLGTDVTAMGVGSLAERLVGGGPFAIITSSALDVLGLSGAAAGGSHDDDLPVLEIPLDVLLGDTAGLEEILEDPIIARAQFVLLLPPFGRSSGRPSRYDMPEIATRNVAAVLAADKRLGCVLLSRSISGRRFALLLGTIIGERYLSTVVELPARELYEQVGPAMRVCVVVLEVTEPPRAVFISIPVTADVETVLEEYATLVSDGGRTEHGFTLEEPIDCTLGILPNQVDPERARRIEETSDEL